MRRVRVGWVQEVDWADGVGRLAEGDGLKMSTGEQGDVGRAAARQTCAGKINGKVNVQATAQQGRKIGLDLLQLRKFSTNAEKLRFCCGMANVAVEPVELLADRAVAFRSFPSRLAINCRCVLTVGPNIDWGVASGR